MFLLCQLIQSVLSREGPGQSGVDLITVRGDIADPAMECQKNDAQLKVKEKKNVEASFESWPKTSEDFVLTHFLRRASWESYSGGPSVLESP